MTERPLGKSKTRRRLAKAGAIYDRAWRRQQVAYHRSHRWACRRERIASALRWLRETEIVCRAERRFDHALDVELVRRMRDEKQRELWSVLEALRG